MPDGSAMPANETERLAFLRTLELIEAPADSAFERASRLTASIFAVPVAAITLVDGDRVRIKSAFGLESVEMDREGAPCADVVRAGRPMAVEDTERSPAFRDWPLARERGLRSLAVAPLRSPDGLCIGTLAIADTRPRTFSDDDLERLSSLADLVMEFVLLRHKRLQSEAASKAKSAFLAHMSHELRTPMTAIIGYTDAVRDGRLDPDEHREACEAVSRNARHLLGVLDDVLDLSRIEAERLRIVAQPVPTLELLFHARTLLAGDADKKGLGLEFEFTTAVPARVRTDETRAKQVLFNLISNAIKFTDTGTVRIETSWRAGPDGGTMTIAVEDTGVGMTEEQLRRVFKPFEQGDAATNRRHGGAGLGLAISRKLAESLGGSLTATSLRGRGSRFVFEFVSGPCEMVEMLPPAASLDAVAARPWEALPSPTGGGDLPRSSPTLVGVRVLVADDSLDNRRLVRHVLERAGALVTLCDSGGAAIEAIDHSPEAYALVLMDVQMPGIDGLEATKALRARGHGLPIIALTAHAMASDRERCLRAGCTDYVSKPFDRAELIAACSKHASPRPSPSRRDEAA